MPQCTMCQLDGAARRISVPQKVEFFHIFGLPLPASAVTGLQTVSQLAKLRILVFLSFRA